MSKICGVCLATTVLLSVAPLVRAQKAPTARETPPLIAVGAIPLPGVHGRFDHFSFDPREPARLFLSALGNNSVEVLNLVTDTRVHSIPNIPEPQGIAHAIGLNKLFVGSRQGKLYIFDGSTYDLITAIDYHGDVDNLRYDEASKRVYVDYGDEDKAAIGMVDATTNQRLPEEYKTGAHPESFQLEKSGSKIYVNLPDLKKIGVIDRTTGKMSSWPLTLEENYPMALNEPEHRLYIATRTPPRLVVYDTNVAKAVATVPCVADVDDLYYDASYKRVYIPGGQGFIDVFQEKDPDHYERIAQIPTVLGARTAGYFGKLGKKGIDRFYLAVPASGDHASEVRTYTVQE